MLLLDSGGFFCPPDHWVRRGEKGGGGWGWRWRSSGPARCHEKERSHGRGMEWGLGREGVKVDLQWGRIGKLGETHQELGYMEGSAAWHLERVEPWKSNQIEAWRGYFCKTRVAVVWQGVLEGEGPKHFVGCQCSSGGRATPWET